MTQEEIIKAFEGRWRIKGGVFSSEDHVQGEIKALCRDFFTAGIFLGECFRSDEITFANGEKGTMIYKSALDCDTLDGGFSIFWNLYEKKVGRPKCEKLWAKLTAKERNDCLSYIPFYKQAQPDKQYRKNPETFLRNKSWNDEIIYHNATDKPTIHQQRIDKLASILTD